MTYRYSSKNKLITGTVGVLFAHGLGTTPDEYFLVPHNCASVPALCGASAPDATNVYVSAGPGGATVSVFAAINHSIIA
jgi:hypothetical protein